MIRIAMRGGVVTLWLASKVFAYATFAAQQGDYWTMFGARTIVYLAIMALWWHCVDAKQAARAEPALAGSS